MKRWLLGLMLPVMVPVSVQAAAPAELSSETGRINYSIGYQVGSDFRSEGWTFDAERFVQGVRAALEQTTPALSSAEMNKTLAALKTKLLADQSTGKVADAEYLAQHAKQAGVVVLPSGVQYRVIKAGSGKMPTLKDSVTIQYKVKRAGGPEIATGYPDSAPKSYALAKALPGLQEALLLMKEGAQWEIVLPPGPAVGSRGETLESAGVLVYDLELIAVSAGQ